jgi:hypothetical protein
MIWINDVLVLPPFCLTVACVRLCLKVPCVTKGSTNTEDGAKETQHCTSTSVKPYLMTPQQYTINEKDKINRNKYIFNSTKTVILRFPSRDC